MHRLHRLRVVQIIWIWQFLMAAIGMISIIFVSMRHVDEGFNDNVQPPASDVDCGLILSGNVSYTRTIAENRRVFSAREDRRLPVDCRSIYQRHYFPKEAASEGEHRFPIAFSRAVYKNYLLLEGEVAALYAPQNHFCFAVDAKANAIFQTQIRALADCFPNVHVTERQFEMNSAGHNMIESHLECMKLLSADDKRWEYLMILQNDDITLRTNEELVQIFKWLGGANDVGAVHGSVHLLHERVNSSMNWTLEHLKVFRHEEPDCMLRNNNTTSINNNPPRLQFAKALVESALSRPAVDYLVKELDFTVLLEQLNAGRRYGIDEMFLSSLHVTDELCIPGAFTHRCLDRNIPVNHLSRFSIWSNNNTSKRCRSGRFRHMLCVFGIEDLVPNLSDNSYLFANKMLPEFDYAAVRCWHAAIHERSTRDRGLQRLRADLYRHLPHVRYHKERERYGSVNITSFSCHHE